MTRVCDPSLRAEALAQYQKSVVSPSGEQGVCTHDARADSEANRAAARQEEISQHWDRAADLWLGEIKKSCDSAQKHEAQQHYEQALWQTRRWWWQWGTYFRPLRWLFQYPERVFGQWAVFGSIGKWVSGFLRLLGLVGIFLLFALILQKPRIRGKSIPYWICAGVEWIFRPRFGGSAHLGMPVALTDKFEVNLFASFLQSAMTEVRGRLQREQLGLQVRGVPFVSLPAELTGTALTSIPTVSGVDIQGWLRVVLWVFRRFRWEVRSQAGYWSKTADGKGGAGVLRAAAMLAWGTTRSRWFVSQAAVSGPCDMEAVAYALAARIMGWANGSPRVD